MDTDGSDDKLFERLAGAAGPVDEGTAPASLKARLFTALVRRQQEAGPLISLRDGRPSLCIFEKAVAAAVVPEDIGRRNPCEVCHARVLAERFENPPIFWPNCPYVDFQK